MHLEVNKIDKDFSSFINISSKFAINFKMGDFNNLLLNYLCFDIFG
jgi:hypothetical protein